MTADVDDLIAAPARVWLRMIATHERDPDDGNSCTCGTELDDRDVAVHVLDRVRLWLQDSGRGERGIYPCGHAVVVRGCGGCDPGAVEWVIDEQGGGRRRPEPSETTLTPAELDPEGTVVRVLAEHTMHCVDCAEDCGCGEQLGPPDVTSPDVWRQHVAEAIVPALLGGRRG